MASAEVVLRGAPDAFIGTPEAKSNGLQVMQLEMTQEVIDQLLESVRSGKPPQILFGRAPQLRYGDRTHVLESSTENLRHELYKTDDNGDFAFAGVINHTLAVQTTDDVTAGVDTALENLKNSLATLNQEKEARKVIVESAPYSHGRSLSSSNRLTPRNNLLKPSSLGTPNRSSPSSPALGASGQRPTSAPQQDSAKMAAIRKTILHIIAAEPKQAVAVSRLIRCNVDETKQILEKIGALGPEGYKLVDRAYKDLDVWNFPYRTNNERQAAIENAIRAYDRSRTPKEDPLWQKLLPKEERGQGKCLSRLKINAPTQAPGSTPVPTLKKQEKKDIGPVIKKADMKKAEAKKSETKRAAAAASTEDGERKVKEKEPVIRKVARKMDATLRNQEPAVKKEPKKEVKKEIKKEVKKVVKKTTAAAAAAAGGAVKTPLQKPKKEVNKTSSANLSKSPSKPVTNKPKTPSPLSASPPVNASDFEEDHPVHKALSAAASPAKSTANSDRPLKRRPEDAEKPVKARKAAAAAAAAVDQDRTPLNGFRQGTSSTPSSGEKKRKATDMDNHSSDRTDTPQKKRHLDPLNTVAASHSRSNGSSQKADASTSPSSSSPTSPPLPLTYQQTIALSQKFQIYYEKYHKLHTQLSKSDKTPTKQQRDELWKMHYMLAKMKEEIRVGALRQQH